MKVFLTALFVVGTFGSLLRAETDTEREFKQARTERTKALAAAADPVNRRYKDVMERLFRKATQAAELDLATAIQAELQTMGGTVAAPVSSLGANSATPVLQRLIEETQWVAQNGGTIVFRSGGHVVSEKIGGGLIGKYYNLEAPDILKVYNTDPAQDPKAAFMFFRVNLARKTAVQDLKVSTISGNVSLKYDGPAKQAK